MQCVGGLEREENTLPGSSLGGLLNVKTACHVMVGSTLILGATLRGPCTTCQATKGWVGSLYRFFKAEELLTGQGCAAFCLLGNAKRLCTWWGIYHQPAQWALPVICSLAHGPHRCYQWDSQVQRCLLFLPIKPVWLMRICINGCPSPLWEVLIYPPPLPAAA